VLHFSRPYTNGRAYATVLGLSSLSALSVTLGVAKLCVLFASRYCWQPTGRYGEAVHEKSISTKMNDLDLCLKVV